MPPTMFEDLALRKLGVLRTAMEEEMLSPELVRQALELVKESPLAKDYFPEVSWRVLWHNLHAPFPNGQVQVLVEPDDDQEAQVRTRLLVARTGEGPAIGYAVGIVDEDYDGENYQAHVQIVSSAAQIGLWVEQMLAARWPPSINAKFESVTVVEPDA